MVPRKTKCPDFFNCSLPKSEQIPIHMSRYHDPRPRFIPNPIPGRPPIKVQRDPARAMHYPCPHPKCNHTSILRTDPRQHQLVCEYRDRTKFNRPTEEDIPARRKRRTQPLGRRQQLQQKQQHRRRAVPRLPVHQPASSRGRSTTPAVSLRPRATDVAATEATDSKHSSRTPTNTLSSTTLDQILATMHQLAETVAGFSNAIDQQTESIDAIGEQMDWLTDQIYQIRNKNEILEVHTESLRIDAGLVEDHLGDLVQDNRRVKEEFRSVLEDVGKIQAMAKEFGQQDVIHLD
ncbi:hypothetical protein EC957_001745 [Mortierella hygrophila]|uniref:Uncharacterized protein n=1 Tax=Mortierella hygrophila TaxID=979708 RepID=A0A9P6F5I1_9FUNG|nr:hypothetical protein EC957_001745 [Mortierella hygrophila]